MKQQVVNEIHRNARKNFIRRTVILKGLDDLWQADLIDLISLKTYNKGFKFILVVIDCFSKFVWVVPLKTKSKIEVLQAFQSIFKKSDRRPINLQTDMGTEFYNNDFKKLMNTYQINHYSTYSVKKASIVERVIRTLKTQLFKSFSLKGSYKWVGDQLEKVVYCYNDTKHRVTQEKPANVKKYNENKVLNNINKYHDKSNCIHKPRFDIGDYVRISKYKGCFQKGYTPNWSTEIFIIRKVNNTKPTTYMIEDIRRQPILGCFYNEELQKTKHPTVYLIEKVIRKKGNKLFVKWLGLAETENSWIDKKAIV